MNGSRIRKARKYREAVRVNGPIKCRTNLETTSVEPRTSASRSTSALAIRWACFFMLTFLFRTCQTCVFHGKYPALLQHTSGLPIGAMFVPFYFIDKTFDHSLA